MTCSRHCRIGCIVLALTILWPTAPVTAQTCVDTTDLLAWWRADGNAADATGVRHGTFVGTERYEAGHSGQAFSFDGASYVAVPHDAAFTGNSGLTVAAWIKRGSQSGFLGPIVKMPGLDDNSGFALEMFGSSAHLYIALEENEFDGTGWRAPVGGFVPADVWTHVAGTFDGTNLRFYINGQLADGRVVPGRIRSAGGQLHIGHDPVNVNRFVTGPIDEAVVFGRALQDEDVRLLYEGGLAACSLDARERPVITWNPAGGITNRTPLDASHLNAESVVPGRFEYMPGAGTLLPETIIVGGTTTLVATFVPDDQVRYQTTKTYRQVSVAWQDFTTERSAPVLGSVVEDVGSSEADAVVDASRDRVWIVGGNGLLVLDGKTGAEITSIIVSTPLSGFLALDAARGHVYAGEAHRSVVRVFDAQTHAEINSFSLSAVASALHVDQAGDRLYVGLRGAGRLAAFTLPVESATAAPVTDLPIGGSVALIASDPVRSLLYVQFESGDMDVAAIDIDPARPTFQSVLWQQPTYVYRAAGLAVHPRTGLVYSGAGAARGVHVLDGRRESPTFGTFLTPFQTPPERTRTRGVSGLALNPAANILYAQLADVGTRDSAYIPELVALDATSGELLSEVRLDPVRHVYGGRLSINPATNRLYVVGDYLSLTVVQDRTSMTQAIGSDTTVTPVTAITPGVEVTFADVTDGGTLHVESVDVSEMGIPAAGQFMLDEAIGFEISTTAAVSAPFLVCINASHVTDPDAFAALSLLHAEVIDGTYQWVDRTVSRDFSTGMVCGETTSLSPFAVARRIGPRYVLTALDNAAPPRQAGSVIPLRVRVAQDGLDVSDARLGLVAVEVVNVVTGATTMPVDAGSSNPFSAFRFDDVTRTYIFNLSTRTLAAASYEVRIRIGTDSSRYAVRFEVR